MKTTIKILSAFLLITFALWYFTNQSRIKLKDKLFIEASVSDSINNVNRGLNDSLIAFKNAKVKIDTVTIKIKGNTVKIYDTVYLDSPVQILKDSVIKKDLKLNYVVEYAGMIYNIEFDYKVPTKIITKENTVYIPKPYPVDKLVPVNKRMLYVGAQISTFKDVSVSFGAMYLDKKHKAYMFNYDPINKSYQFGCYYKLF